MNRCCGFPLAQPAYQSPMETATSRSPRIPSSLPCCFIITGLLNSAPRHRTRPVKRRHRNITDLLLRSGLHDLHQSTTALPSVSNQARRHSFHDVARFPPLSLWIQCLHYLRFFRTVERSHFLLLAGHGDSSAQWSDA